jgi:hypothetical protein
MGREKPGKPRRPRAQEEHAHRGWTLEAVPQPAGWQADSTLFEAVTGAVFEGCVSCQDASLTLLIEDAVTTARVAELACGAIINVEGHLPPSHTDPDLPDQASSPEFRRLAGAAQGKTTDGMYHACERMTPTERRAAVNTALDIIAGYAALGFGQPRPSAP